MASDDELHPGHHSMRLKHRDYSLPGLYFVTICTHEKACILGRIVDRSMYPSPLGNIVAEIWNALPAHFAHVKLPAFVLMPNHVHGLIEIGCLAGTRSSADTGPEAVSAETPKPPRVVAGSLGAIIRSFKSAARRRIRLEVNYAGEIWQRNYFERVVRDGKEFGDVCQYIVENPLMWERDSENPGGRGLVTSGPGQAGAQHAAPLQRLSD
jgi:REP-associated tyrosine transposase